jgi:hypothetical protein
MRSGPPCLREERVKIKSPLQSLIRPTAFAFKTCLPDHLWEADRSIFRANFTSALILKVQESSAFPIYRQQSPLTSLSLLPVARCDRSIDDEFGSCRLFRVVEDVGEMALAAVLAVVHSSHEDTSTALLLRALPPQTLDLSVTVDLVVLKNGQLGLLALVLDLLGCSIDLLLALLGHTTTQAKDEMEG